MSSKWQPWETFKEDPPVLNIPEPPCKGCAFWKPQRKYMNLKTGIIFDGVICCHSDDMHHDFSCFTERA